MARVISIAGGGLAGLAAGLGLRRAGVPVVLHEAGSYPRHRVCGEFLCGVTPETLEHLGLRGILQEAVPLKSMAWYREERAILRSDLPLPAHGISRYALDARMAELFVEAGGELRLRSRVEVGAREGMLDCTGRRPTPGGWVGLKAHFAGLPLEADLEMHLGRRSYVGLSSIEGGRVNVCGLFPGDSLKGQPREQLMARALESAGLGALQGRLAGAQMIENSLVAVAAFQPGWVQPGGRSTLGDARAAIPPFTGNGMSMALESGELAAGALALYSLGKLSWVAGQNKLHRAIRRRFGLRMRQALTLHPFLLHPLGQSLLSMGVFFRVLPLRSMFLRLRGAG